MIGLILMIIAFVGMWKTFEKAGMEGWKGIVPVYNMYLLITEIAKKPWWYLLLLFVPIANIVIMAKLRFFPENPTLKNKKA